MEDHIYDFAGKKQASVNVWMEVRYVNLMATVHSNTNRSEKKRGKEGAFG